MDKEQQLAQAIARGTLTDRDIIDITDHGSRSLRRQLDEREQYLRKEKAHLDKVYGKDTWDGRDEHGRLFKDLDNSSMIDTLKGRSL